jgi:hypothetical protein
MECTRSYVPATTLVLLGPQRNLATFSSKNDGQSPTRTVIFTLNPLDGTTTSANASPADAGLLGGAPATAPDGEVGTVILPPADRSVDPQQRADATATISSYAFHADGSVVSDCYPSILAPFRVVPVRGVDGRQSGDWLIVEVTHMLSRSVYTQSFKLARNAISAGSGAAATNAPAGIH